MKRKIGTVLLTVCVTAAAYAQSPPSATDRTRNAKTAARIERHRLASKENNLFVTGASGITAHNQVTVGVKVEYSRQLKGNFYWGVDIYKLDAMAYYRLPVVKSRLFLRFGAGVGAGYHRILKHVDNDLDKDRVLPFFNVECAWILRVTKGFELKFSPTILFVPSEFSVSPVELGAPTDVTPWLTDAGFSLTCGWRF